MQSKASSATPLACCCPPLPTWNTSTCARARLNPSPLCPHPAAAFQHERKVRVYEPGRDWRLRKDVYARSLRWTVTDTDISPTEQFLIYASITSTVHLVRPGFGSLGIQGLVG